MIVEQSNFEQFTPTQSRDSERNDFCLERNQFRKPIVMEIFERFKNRLDGGTPFKLSDLIKGIELII
jgi:hypothetical protein